MLVSNQLFYLLEVKLLDDFLLPGWVHLFSQIRPWFQVLNFVHVNVLSFLPSEPSAFEFWFPMFEVIFCLFIKFYWQTAPTDIIVVQQSVAVVDALDILIVAKTKAFEVTFAVCRPFPGLNRTTNFKDPFNEGVRDVKGDLTDPCLFGLFDKGVHVAQLG